MKEELIKDYFYLNNLIVLSIMYLEDFNQDKIKKYNPGHLGSSININFILANLAYFINEKNLSSKLVIGTGHAGSSLISNLFTEGTLSKYYKDYPQTASGLNNLIKDFGKTIRTEINPQYPKTIYDGGELGYSLAVAYGYAMGSSADIVPCIIGDGECETGTLSSSWYLNKMLNPKSKVLPIIDLNGLKMNSNSYLSMFSDDELNNYFTSLGYEVFIVDAYNKNIIEVIKNMQSTLNKSINTKSPLIIFKSPKGYTLPNYKNYSFEGNKKVHKNPLAELSLEEKKDILQFYFKYYDVDIFDNKGNILDKYNKFKFNQVSDQKNNIIIKNISLEDNCSNITYASNYLNKFLDSNKSIIFSPDELSSNGFEQISKYTFEILNENVLQALLQGYTQSGNRAFFIGYEGFMPIISSMIDQYQKYLIQKKQLPFSKPMPSLTYILTSTCFENTYSHQNPSFASNLLLENSDNYNILYPKDGKDFVKCLEQSIQNCDKINIVTISKRHDTKYEDSDNLDIQIIKDCENPDLIICATGDYMLDLAIKIEQDKSLNNKKIKIIYITNPKILDINSKIGLSKEEFDYYFNNSNTIYLYSGNPNCIKSLLYDRNKSFKVLGYQNKITVFGNLENNLKSNNLTTNDIIDNYIDKPYNRVLRRENE